MAYNWGMKLALQFAIGVVLALPALAGEVHVVALDGTGDFSKVQDAVDFASDGDTIVVEGGTYSWTFGSGGGSALISGKGLDIVSGTGDPRLTGTIEVRDLGPGQDVRIAGLTANIVIVRDCAGDVLLEGLNLAFGWSCRLSVVNSQAVCVTDSLLLGGGGDPGLDAVTVIGSKVRFFGCTMAGGDGDDGTSFPCGIGYDGGDGLVVVGSTSLVRYSNCTFSGGWGGWGCPSGIPGVPINAPSGTVVQLAVPVTRLTGPPRAVGGTSVDLEVTGPPGSSPLLITTTDLATVDLPLSVGTLHMMWPFVIEPLPPIPPGGVLTHSLAVPTPPVGQARLRIMQVVFKTPTKRFLSQPLGFTVVH